MSNYGRNFEFRISPPPDQRRGRYITGADVIPIGAPVEMLAQAPDVDGRNEVALATGATPPKSGMHGIAVFEHAYNAFAGFDPVLRTASDFSDIPPGSPIQLVSGTEVKVVLRNTEAADITFLGAQRGTPRTMVGPTNLTGLAVGDGLGPGTGDDTAGYWAEAIADPWLVVTSVDVARGEVEAQLQF